MSSHGGSVPCQTGPILVGILFALVTPLIGQGTPGHFYHVNYYQVQQGQEKVYDSAHLVIVEVAKPSAAEGSFQQQLDAASQATLHRSWNDATAGFPELRRFVHAEQYTTVGQGH